MPRGSADCANHAADGLITSEDVSPLLTWFMAPPPRVARMGHPPCGLMRATTALRQGQRADPAVADVRFVSAVTG